jgi:antitoxin component HigA of HigAB toxin-antitoxin module
MAKVDVSKAVVKAMKNEGFNFWQLVEELGISSVKLSQCLRGERELAPEHIGKLEKKLKIKLPDKMKIKGK